VTRTPSELPPTGAIPIGWDGAGNPATAYQMNIGDSLYYAPVDPFAADAGHLFQYVSTATDPTGWIDLGLIRGPQGIAGQTGPAGQTGAQGPIGVAEQWYGSTINPTGAVGADGDWYLNTNTGDVFERVTGAWQPRGNIKGPQGDVGVATTIVGEFTTRAATTLPPTGIIPAGWDGAGTFPGGRTMAVGESLIDNNTASGTYGDLWQYVSTATDPAGWIDVGKVVGPTGPTGPTGPAGPVGPTLSGGTTGQALVKTSNTDGAIAWGGPHLPLTGGVVSGDVTIQGVTNDHTADLQLNQVMIGGVPQGGNIIGNGGQQMIQFRKLASTNGGGAANPAPTTTEAIRFAYQGTPDNFHHEIRSVHHSGQIAGNALEVLLHGSTAWSPPQATTAPAVNRVMRLAGDRVDIYQPLYVNGYRVPTSAPGQSQGGKAATNVAVTAGQYYVIAVIGINAAIRFTVSANTGGKGIQVVQGVANFRVDTYGYGEFTIAINHKVGTKLFDMMAVDTNPVYSVKIRSVYTGTINVGHEVVNVTAADASVVADFAAANPTNVYGTVPL
jgi:hypothetical protein